MKSLAFAVLLLSGPAFAEVKSFNSGKGATVDCNKDPEVHINHGKGTYVFTGTCKAIQLNGGDSKLTIESVADLNINGGKNTVDIGSVDSINVNGAGNTITYKKSGKGDKPAINTVGAGNKIDHAK